MLQVQVEQTKFGKRDKSGESIKEKKQLGKELTNHEGDIKVKINNWSFKHDCTICLKSPQCYSGKITDRCLY